MRDAQRRTPHESRRGAALVLALLTSVVLVIFVTSLLSTRVVELRAISGTVGATTAQFIAEAGVDYVLALLVRDGGELPGSPPYYSVRRSFGGGTFDAVADEDPSSGRLRIVSAGRAPGGIERTVEVLLDLERSNRVVRQFGLLTCGDLTLSGSSQVINGDVYSGGRLSINRAGAVTNGDAMAYGSVSFGGEGSITGNVLSETGSIALVGGDKTLVRAGGYASNPGPPTTTTLTAVQARGGVDHSSATYDMPDYCLPKPDAETPGLEDLEVPVSPTAYSVNSFDEYRIAAKVDGEFAGNVRVTSGSNNGYWTDPGTGEYEAHYVGGSMVIEGTPPGQAFAGTYFIEGNLTVKGTYSGTATFVVFGNLIVEGESSTGAAEVSSAYIVNGDVSLAGGSSIDGAIYTNGIVNASGSATVNGSVIAMGTGGIAGSLTVRYLATDTEVVLPNARLIDFSVQRWRLVTN